MSPESAPPRLRVVFMGTAPLACASLGALARGAPGVEVITVVTQPDRPKGRDLKLQPSAVKETALRLNLPVLQPERARAPEFIDEIKRLAPDLIVVVAFGQILPQSLLDVPRHGCLNVHTSILPRHRGAAPIQWALLDGDAETGVTIMRMDAGLDTGPVVAVETEGADSLARSVVAGRPVELTAITSIATSLGATRVYDQAFSWSQKHPLHNVVVSDRAAVTACLKFIDDQRIVVEPACGASLAAVYDRAPALEEYDSVLVVVCCGVTSTVAQLQEWSNKLA